ncbi:hypothetical protein AB0A94_27005 [Streptomyces sp. NPDC044984]|uniref:hypothetical protein n=1 Tax=Streptomyces sp. NPDC044984 TaxID=3154335 RepID=UPI0033CB383F
MGDAALRRPDARTSHGAALECYPYEPADRAHRGLVLHDEAWHWAMPAIHGGRYPVEHPELVHPPSAYQALE